MAFTFGRLTGDCINFPRQIVWMSIPPKWINYHPCYEMGSILSEAPHCSNSDLSATVSWDPRTVAAPHVTVITFRVTWASGFPSACQDRAEQQRALWYRNLHLIHKPVGSSPPLTHPIKNQQWRYLDLELFHKQVKFAYANILKVWWYFFLSFSFLLEAENVHSGLPIFFNGSKIVWEGIALTSECLGEAQKDFFPSKLWPTASAYAQTTCSYLI